MDKAFRLQSWCTLNYLNIFYKMLKRVDNWLYWHWMSWGLELLESFCWLFASFMQQKFTSNLLVNSNKYIYASNHSYGQCKSLVKMLQQGCTTVLNGVYRGKRRMSITESSYFSEKIVLLTIYSFVSAIRWELSCFCIWVQRIAKVFWQKMHYIITILYFILIWQMDSW